MTDVEVRRPVALRVIPGVELAAIGTWKASTGETTFTHEDFVDAVAALECPGVRNPVIKLGHDEEDSTSGVRWDGEPAVGWIGNMRYDVQSAKMIGDYMGVPAWMADPDPDTGISVLMAAYPDRSIEIRRPFVCQIGHTHPSVITALSLLGVYAPGVGVLKSMQDVYAAMTEPLDSEVARVAANLTAHGLTLSTTVRLAAEPRELTDAEKRATTDFARLQGQWDAALDDLLEQWPDVAEDQREQLSAQIADAVDSDPDRLGSLEVDAELAAALLAAGMVKLAGQSAAETVAEAKRQGVDIDPPEITEDDVRDVATAVTSAMAASTASTAGRNAAQLLGSGDGRTVATGVLAGLAALGDGFLRTQLGGALSAAQATGRFAVLKSGPDGTHYASEVNDTATCSPCKSIDGKRFDSLDEAESAYGAGQYTGCSGGGRCRGQLITVYDGPLARAAAPLARLSTTVRTSLGGPMPTRTDGAVKASVSVEDISRKYYESAGYSRWITAMHVDPLELIAADDSDGKYYRVPVTLNGDEFEFGDAQEVAIQYTDVAAAAAALPHRWGDKRSALAAAGKAEDGTDLRPATQPEGEPPIAPDVTPAGAAIRKMASATKTPDAETSATGSTTTPEGGSGMDPVKLREALGLAADASDEDTRAAALAALTSDTPAAPSTDDLNDMAALASAGQAVVVDKAVLTDLVTRAKKGEIAYNQNRKNERDSFLKTAVTEGRIPPASLSAYERLWDIDPEGTRRQVSLLAKNIIPTQSVGFLGAEPDLNEADSVYEGMYGKAGR